MDWKEALASLSGLPEGKEPQSSLPEDTDAGRTAPQKSHLHVLIEKKGRGGKTATIVEGFEISDDEVEEIGRTLRKKLGCGGSARGGEILIQGERKDDTMQLLRDMGFKVKG